VSERTGIISCALSASRRAIKKWARLPYGLLLAALLLGATSIHTDRFAPPAAKPRSSAQWARLFSALPMSFEVNQGQTDREVNFLSRGQGYTLFLTREEAVLRLKGRPSVDGSQLSASRPRFEGALAPGRGTTASGLSTTDSVLRLRLVGADVASTVTGADPLPGHANYFLGNDPKKWLTDVPMYAQVKYQGVYPGVDLVYYGARGGQIEYDFVVAPGADPTAIVLDIGAVREPPKRAHRDAPLQIAANGDLVVKADGCEVRFHKPVVYQPAINHGPRTSDPGLRTAVEGRYVLQANNQVGFALGPYDHHRPLIIDPYLTYATYVGGSGGDIGYAIAVDSNFDAYIAGVTNSSNFPTKGPEQPTYATNGDAFVTKFNSTGTALLYSTYIGGSGSDTATAIAVSGGSAYITGNTTSTNFPTKAPQSGATTIYPFQTTYGGNTDAFVAELNTTGNLLIFSSYLGGSAADFGQGIAVDSAGNVYVTGSTESANFPTANPLYGTNSGNGDVFITEINPTGTTTAAQLLFSTFLGGAQADVAQAIQVTTSGSNANIYVAGYTFSTNFPVSATPFQATNAGAPDAFVAEITLNTSNESSALTFSTYLGGSGDDRAYGLALDGTGNVYVTGATDSTGGSPFPTISDAFQTSLHGQANAFVTKLNPTGSSLIYSTYLGGSGTDLGNAIAVDSAGHAFVTGSTNSSDFPASSYNPIQAILGISAGPLCGTAPCSDAFITQLTGDGTGLVYSSYLGGSGPDFGQGIALDSNGVPYITGSTSSTNFPAIAGAYQSSLAGVTGNAFVAKIDPADQATIALVPGTVNFGNETLSVTSPQQQVTVINPGTEPLTITEIAFNHPYTTTTTPPTTITSESTYGFAETDNCVGVGGSGALSPGGGTCTINLTFTPPSVSAQTDQLTITDNAYIAGAASTSQTLTVTGTGVTAATAVTVYPTTLTFPNQSVGTVSAPQNVTITNTGTATLNISNITTSTGGDYSQTNTCGALLNTLSVGQSCSVSVTFSPTASGTRSGSLSITDNATGSPQTVAISGTGLAEFSITTTPSLNNNPVLIGSTSTTFSIGASGPSSFTGNISLACSSGTTCAFNPTTISVGHVSTLTVSNLTTNMTATPGNPYAFTVTGVSGSQTASLQLNLLFEDFSLSITPPSDVIAAGSTATYTILVNPLNGLTGQKVDLACETTGAGINWPPDATCTFSNATPTPSGTASSIQLKIQTQVYVTPTLTPPRIPTGKLPPLILGLVSFAALASLALGARHRSRHGPLARSWLGVRLAAISLILTLNLALGSCRPSTLVTSGTTTGSYSITITGKLDSNSAVVRYATTALSVT